MDEGKGMARLAERSVEALRCMLGLASQPHGRVPTAEIIRAAAALEGRAHIDFDAARQIGLPVIVLREGSGETPVFNRLSPREQGVARLLVQGLTNRQIAHKLGLSLATIKDHVHHALDKTDMGTRAELAAALAREGL
jgi:DNA-binding NarL/FixJ family response regulator